MFGSQGGESREVREIYEQIGRKWASGGGNLSIQDFSDVVELKRKVTNLELDIRILQTEMRRLTSPK